MKTIKGVLLNFLNSREDLFRMTKKGLIPLINSFNSLVVLNK